MVGIETVEVKHPWIHQRCCGDVELGSGIIMAGEDLQEKRAGMLSSTLGFENVKALQHSVLCSVEMCGFIAATTCVEQTKDCDVKEPEHARQHLHEVRATVFVLQAISCVMEMVSMQVVQSWKGKPCENQPVLSMKLRWSLN